jgi:dynein light intermediate chain, axonemal
MALIPPTLVRMEAPTMVDGPAELAATVGSRRPGQPGKGASDPVMEDIVNSILPPRMWSQPDGTTWMQYASKEPASRLDVLSLQDALDERLAQRQARDTGICPVREDLYRQCFG